MIIIHIGGNDLVQMKQRNLMRKIKKDLQYVASVFSTSYIVWSDILPRAEWRGLESTLDNLKKINKKRKRVNREGRLVASELPLGRAIINYDIDIKHKVCFCKMAHICPLSATIFFSQLYKMQLHHSLMIQAKHSTTLLFRPLNGGQI